MDEYSKDYEDLLHRLGQDFLEDFTYVVTLREAEWWLRRHHREVYTPELARDLWHVAYIVGEYETGKRELIVK